MPVPLAFVLVPMVFAVNNFDCCGVDSIFTFLYAIHGFILNMLDFGAGGNVAGDSCCSKQL